MPTTTLHSYSPAISIQARFFNEVQSMPEESMPEEAPASDHVKADENLLELTTPTKTAEDVPWDSRLVYIPHKHRWPS